MNKSFLNIAANQSTMADVTVNEGVADTGIMSTGSKIVIAGLSNA